MFNPHQVQWLPIEFGVKLQLLGVMYEAFGHLAKACLPGLTLLNNSQGLTTGVPGRLAI